MGDPISDVFSSFNDNDSAEKIISANEENQAEGDVKTIDSVVEKQLVVSESVCDQKSLSDDKVAGNAGLDEIKQLAINLAGQFESKIKYDKHKEEIINKLHAENQQLRNDLYQKLILPLVNEIIMIHDDYLTLFKKHSEVGPADVDSAKLLKQFGDISPDLENALYKVGVDSFSVDGDVLDTTRQKVIKTVITDDIAKDKTVCEKIRKGFVVNGKVIRMEMVSCYKYENKIDKINL